MVRISSKITYNDLTGGINNVNSIETINATPRRTETPEMVNIEYFKLGGIKTMEGNIQVGDTQPSPVVGGWEYTKNNSRYMMIALKSGEVKVLDSVTEAFKLVYKFNHVSDRVSFCNMNNGVVVSNGVDDMVFYEANRHTTLSGTVSTTAGSDVVIGISTVFKTELNTGDTIEINDKVYFVDTVTSNTELKLRTNVDETLSNVNYYLSEISECNATLINEEDNTINTPIRGRAIQYYNGRLWVGTDNGLFYSQVGQYNKWDIKYDAGVIYSIYNDTSEIQALGLYASYLLIHKKFDTYSLVCNGDSSTIKVEPYSNITCGSQQSWIVSNTKYYVYSSQHMDIYPLLQRTVFQDRYLGEPITVKVRNIFQNLREADQDKIFCVSLPRNRWMVFYLPMVDQLGSAYGLVYDFQTKSWLCRKVPQEVTIAFNYFGNIYIGTKDGKVLKEFTGKTFDGKVIESYYRSPWFDWADGYTQSFSEFAIELANEYNNSFYIRSYKDGSSPYEDRIIDSDKLTGDALIWDGREGADLPNNDTVWNEDRWVTGSFEHIRMLLPNNVFDKFQLEIGTNTEGQAFAIYGYGFRRIETDEAPW